MSDAIIKLFEQVGGEFVSPPSLFIDRLAKVRAVLFDWDGVFNDGTKRGTDGSIFSEVDAMGTNLLRYALYRKNGSLPVTAIMSGENNPAAVALGQRERFDDILLLAKNKAAVFQTFCEKHELKGSEVLFFFDDVLDLEVARQCGARVMIGRKSTPLLQKFVRESTMADYIACHDGGRHGLREGCELVIGLLGMYDAVVKNRMTFSDDYQAYLSTRQKVETALK